MEQAIDVTHILKLAIQVSISLNTLFRKFLPNLFWNRQNPQIREKGA
jgi:hypothetical protein